jgi:BirA family biotin operon repressor/biotin-[acetyl-CoA-carboxylase] ligase
MFPPSIQSYSIIYLPTVDSTNNYAATKENQPNIQHKSVILASFQTKGKGQYSNKWQSEKGLNLLFSICLFPAQLSSEHQFDLSRISALAIRDTVNYFLSKAVYIKWPNDIFILNKKIAGILIENTLNQNKIERSIIGIGLNINQKEFEGIEATSFLNESGKEWDLKRILEFFLYRFDHYYESMQSNRAEILKSFDLHLFRRNEWQQMESSTLGVFKGKIIGTESNGMLQVEDEHGHIHHFNHKEVSFS